MDLLISTVADTKERQHLIFDRYLDKLGNRSWGDNVTLQGICDMLNITVKILQVTCNNTVLVTTVLPRNNKATSVTVHIGLVLQYHFVGLDPIHVSSSTAVNSDTCNTTAPRVNIHHVNNSDNVSSTNEFDNETISQDEHLRINTGPSISSMLSVENPEAGNILSIAPAEGQKPLSIRIDAKFEEISNPDKFPFGNGGFNTERTIKWN